MPDPDFIYDPDDWEYTSFWSDRNDLLDDVALGPGDVKRYETLVKGPPRFAAVVVTDYDEDGCPGEWETRWFDTEEAAKEAAKLIEPV